jgi:hypothetical protein
MGKLGDDAAQKRHIAAELQSRYAGCLAMDQEKPPARSERQSHVGISPPVGSPYRLTLKGQRHRGCKRNISRISKIDSSIYLI